MKIDKDIPIADFPGPNKNVAAKMEIGDSVLFHSQTLAQGLRIQIKKQGFRAVGRTVENGFRIWKVASIRVSHE